MCRRLGNICSISPEIPGNQPACAVVIRACSAIVDRHVAAALVNILNDIRESPTVQNAAADALIDLTGLTDFGRDPAAWKNWNAANAGKKDDDWKLAVYASRDARLDEIAQRHARLLTVLDVLLTAEFQSAVDKNATVLRYLNAGEPEVRAIGARLVRDAFLSGLAAPTDAQKSRLTELVGDSDPHVRLETARTLKAINFGAALDAMMAQLAIEKDPDVKVALAGAIAQTGDLRAVPLFRRMLRDPSMSVELRRRGGAANAWSRVLQGRPERRARTGAGTVECLSAGAGDPGSADLQAACLDAMAPLHENSLVLPLVRLLDPEQNERCGPPRCGAGESGRSQYRGCHPHLVASGNRALCTARRIGRPGKNRNLRR